LPARLLRSLHMMLNEYLKSNGFIETREAFLAEPGDLPFETSGCPVTPVESPELLSFFTSVTRSIMES
jgi:hypothetical protein